MSLVIRYPFNGSTSTFTTDYSGNSNTSTNEGGVVSAVDATYGNVASFSNASGSSLTLAPSPAFLTGSSSRTISFWFKRNDENASFEHLFGSSPASSQYRVQIAGLSLWRSIMLLPAGENAVNTSFSSGFLTGVWYHAAITYDGTTEVLYIDGSQENSTVRSLLVGGDSFTIGGSPSFTTNYRLDGYMSDFRVYDDALSATEVSTLHTDGPNPPPIVNWVLDTNGKYEVSSREHLIQIMNDGTIYANTGDVPTPQNDQWGRANYIQTADIDLLGDSTNIRSMGFSSNWAGEYDGNGFTVSNWVYVEDNFPNPTTTSFRGFFSWLNNGTVKNFRLAGVCSISGFSHDVGFIADNVTNNSIVSNIEVDLSPGSFITQSSTEVTGNVRVGGVFGRLETLGSATGITFKGQLDSITLSGNAGLPYVGGVVGWLRNSSGTNTLFRNLGTFPGGLTGTRVGGVIGKMDASNITKVLNAMTGDLTETIGGSYVGGVIGELVQNNASQIASEFVNSMKGNITGTTTNSHVGGIIGRMDQETGSTIHSLFNYMTGDIINTFNAGRASGLLAVGIGSLNFTTSINAMNGSVYYPTTGFPSTGVESNIDLSFGLTYNTESNITTTPLGLPTDSEVGLPIFDLTATDPDSVVLTFEFVFGNLPREFNQLRIDTSGQYMNFSELQIFDMTGTNIALLGTASGTGGGQGGPELGNDGGTEHAFSSDPLVNTVVDMYDANGSVYWLLDLNRGYTLAEINKVIFYNRSGGVEAARAVGNTVSLYSSDGGDPEQVGVLTSDLIQEFIVTAAPEFLLPTAGVTSISATVVEVTGASTYQINVTESPSGTTRVAHTGISTGDFIIGGLNPETTYVLQLYADTGSGYSLEDTETVTTLANSASNYDITVYGDNGEFDLSTLDNSSFALLDEVINDLFTTGDNLEIKLGPKTSDVAFVKVGEAISTEKSILVPFNSSSGSGQVITMTLSDTSNVSVSYNEVNNSITIDGSTLELGDSIIIDGKKMTVKGV